MELLSGAPQAEEASGPEVNACKWSSSLHRGSGASTAVDVFLAATYSAIVNGTFLHTCIHIRIGCASPKVHPRYCNYVNLDRLI